MNTNSPSDAGSLKRGVLLLKVLATAGRRGLPLTEISTRAELPHPSVHRVLQQLSAERLVDRNPELKRYRLGPLAFELGMASSTMYDIHDLCAPSMEAVAKDTADTVYRVMRSGFDAVCMHRLEGSFPIRTLVLEVGSRRPLGVGAGGLAILADISLEARSEIIERVTPNLSRFSNLDADGLVQACQRTHELGYALIQNNINLGVTAVGQPFRDAMGQPIGALSVAALTQRMTASRIRRVASHLKKACTEVEQRLRSLHRAGWEVG